MENPQLPSRELYQTVHHCPGISSLVRVKAEKIVLVPGYTEEANQSEPNLVYCITIKKNKNLIVYV